MKRETIPNTTLNSTLCACFCGFLVVVVAVFCCCFSWIADNIFHLDAVLCYIVFAQRFESRDVADVLKRKQEAFKRVDREDVKQRNK